MMTDQFQDYLDTLGNVPPPIRHLFSLSETVGEAYTAARRTVYAPSDDGLTLVMKEMTFVVLDIVHENLSGARNHLAAARAVGLTEAQLRDTLVIVFLMTGMSTWGKIGSQLWSEFLGEEPETS